MKKLLLISITMIFCRFSTAGSTAGNGGHGVGCRVSPNGNIASVILHDFYEGRYRYHLIPSLGDRTLTVEQKANLALKRLSRLDPERAARYQSRLNHFWENANKWPNAHLVFVSDSNYVAIETGCELVQVAIQKLPEFPQEKYFTIDETYWNLMDDDSKAGLLLHEIVYEEAISFGHQDSTKARYFTALITSGDVENMSTTQYAEIAKVMGFPLETFLFNGVNYVYNSLEFYPNGNMQSGILSGNAPFELKNISVEDGKVFLLGGTRVFFHPNGSLKHGTVAGETSFMFGSCRLTLNLYKNSHSGKVGDEFELSKDGYLESFLSPYSSYRFCIPLSGPYHQNVTLAPIMLGSDESERPRFYFHRTGVVKKAKLISSSIGPDREERWKLPPFPKLKHPKYPGHTAAHVPKQFGELYYFENKAAAFLSGSEIEFFETGFVHKGMLYRATTFTTSKGDEKEFPPGSKVEFDESGRVIE